MDKDEIIQKSMLFVGLALIFISIFLAFSYALNINWVLARYSNDIALISLPSGIVLTGISRIATGEPKNLKLPFFILILSLISWLVYESVFFYLQLLKTFSSLNSTDLHAMAVLNTPLNLQLLRYSILSSIGIYFIALIIFFLKDRKPAIFIPLHLSMGILFALLFLGDILMYSPGGMDLNMPISTLSGNNLLLGFGSFALILLSLSITMAIDAYIYRKVDIARSFLALIFLSFIFQAVFFYGTSVEYGVGLLFGMIHGKYFLGAIIRGILEVAIAAGFCYLACEFAVSIRGKLTLIEILSIAIPVSATALLLLIIYKGFGSALFTGYLSMNMQKAIELYILLILTASTSIFLSNNIKKESNRFITVAFPLILLATPIFGMDSANNSLNFQVIFTYTILLIISAIFISDTIFSATPLLKKVLSNQLGIPISTPTNKNTNGESDSEIEEDTEKILLHENIRRPLPQFWIGKRLWGFMVIAVGGSFNDAFFQLEATSKSIVRKDAIIVLKQYSNAGKKLALDQKILDSMINRFEGLKTLSKVPNIQHVMETHCESAEFYAEDVENYKEYPPVAVMEHIPRLNCSILDFSLESGQSREAFFKSILTVLFALREIHKNGIIHGNICDSTIIFPGSTRMFDILSTFELNPRVEALVVTGEIKPILTGFLGDTENQRIADNPFNFSPYYYPPEFATNDAILSKQSDIYQVCCLMYEILSAGSEKKLKTGAFWEREKFIRAKVHNELYYETKDQMVHDVGRFKLEDLRAFSKRVDNELWKIILRGLDPDPSVRYSEVDELIHDLENIAKEKYGIVL